MRACGKHLTTPCFSTARHDKAQSLLVLSFLHNSEMRFCGITSTNPQETTCTTSTISFPNRATTCSTISNNLRLETSSRGVNFDNFQRNVSYHIYDLISSLREAKFSDRLENTFLWHYLQTFRRLIRTTSSISPLVRGRGLSTFGSTSRSGYVCLPYCFRNLWRHDFQHLHNLSSNLRYEYFSKKTQNKYVSSPSKLLEELFASHVRSLFQTEERVVLQSAQNTLKTASLRHHIQTIWTNSLQHLHDLSQTGTQKLQRTSAPKSEVRARAQPRSASGCARKCASQRVSSRLSVARTSAQKSFPCHIATLEVADLISAKLYNLLVYRSRLPAVSRLSKGADLICHTCRTSKIDCLLRHALHKLLKFLVDHSHKETQLSFCNPFSDALSL